MNYCIIGQSSGAMAMRSPDLIYLGTDEAKVKKLVAEFMETNFKNHCKMGNSCRYYRLDDDADFDSWDDLLKSLYDELIDEGRLIIDFNEWNCEEPGFFCVYAREDVQGN